MRSLSDSIRVLSGCILAVVYLAGAPAFAQSVVPDDFCPKLKAVVAALSGEKHGSLKGKRLSKTEWEARENLPGMGDCAFEADTFEETGGSEMMKALTSFSEYRCDIVISRRKIDSKGVKDVAEFKKLARDAAIESRERAIRMFEAFDRAIGDCIPGLSVERSIGELGLEKGLPKTVFKKKDQPDIDLRMLNGITNYRIRFGVEDHFFRGR